MEQLEAGLGQEKLGRPINILILGMGEIGLMAAKAFKNLSNERLKSIGKAHPGLKVTMLPRSITGSDELLKNELEHSDILVDETFRPDPSKIIVKNELIGALPEHAVILDITADPYDFETDPPQFKAIEGTPTGTLDQMVFKVDDKIYDVLEKHMTINHKRLAVSCNAWPGADPEGAMTLYAHQLLPIIEVLIEKGHEDLKIESKNYYERVICRSSYDYFKQ